MVEGSSYMFVTGPNVVKTVTHEDVDAEFLGGAGTHTSRSGVAHLAAVDEATAFDHARALLSFLPSNNLADAPVVETRDPASRMDAGLDGVIPDDPRTPYEMHDVIGASSTTGDCSRSSRDGRRTSSSGSRDSAAGVSASSRSSRRCWPVRSTSMRR